MPGSIDRINPPALPDTSQIGYSQISIAKPASLAFVSGQVAWQPNRAEVPVSLEAQTAIVIENLREALNALKATSDDIIQMRVYMTDLRPETQEIAMTQLLSFLDGARPSLTGVGVAILADPHLQIEVEMVVQLSP